MTAAARPGWYPDPAGDPDPVTGGFRWWDGTDWTDDTAGSAHSPAPPPPPGRPTRFRTAVAMTLALTLFVGASVTAGLVLWGDRSAAGMSDSVAPCAPAGSAAAGVPGQLDLQTRVATIGPASMTLPPDPYELTQDPRQVPGLFDVLFMANAAVHERYEVDEDGANPTWSATVVLARLSAEVAGAGLEARGRNALDSISTSFFDGRPTELTEVRAYDSTRSGCTGMLMTARVGYHVAHLPSRYDVVSVQLVELTDGSVIVAVSSVPDDTDPAVAALADAALQSLVLG